MRQAISESPPPELAGASSAEIEQFINQASQEIAGGVPSNFEFDESSFPPDVRAIIERVRQIVPYVSLAYWGLIGLMLLLILGVILINRDVRSTTRSFGTTFFIYGALEYAGVYAANYLMGTQLTTAGMPAVLESWLPQFLGDFLAPLQTFGIGLMAAGVVLIIVSFVYRRGATV